MDKDVTIPKPRTAYLDADQLEELAAAVAFAEVNKDDFFISPETGRPVRKTYAKQHALDHYGHAAAAIAAGQLPEQAARRDHILAQHVDEEDQAPATTKRKR